MVLLVNKQKSQLLLWEKLVEVKTAPIIKISQTLNNLEILVEIINIYPGIADEDK